MIPKLFPQAIFGCIWYNILKGKKYMYTNAILLLLLYYLEEGEFLYQKAQKKFWAPGENIELTTLQVLVCTLQPLSHWRLYGKQGRNLIITTRTVMSFSPLFISFYLRSSYGRSLVPLLSRPPLCCKLFITYHSDYIATVNLTRQTIKCTWQPPR